MKKFLSSKPLVAVAGVLGTVAAFAEGGAGGSGTVDSSLVTSFITTGQTQIVNVLTAGAAIVGAFFVWRLIKKALNKSA